MSRQTAYDVETCEWDSSDGEQYWITDSRHVAAFLSKPHSFRSTKRSKLLETFPVLDNDYSSLIGMAMAAPLAHKAQSARPLAETTAPSANNHHRVATVQLEGLPPAEPTDQHVQYSALQPHQTLDDVDTQEDDTAGGQKTVMVLYGFTGTLQRIAADVRSGPMATAAILMRLPRLS